MRILIILEYYYPHIGGVETFFKTLTERLDQEGHHVTILTNQYDRSLAKSEKVGEQSLIVRRRYFNRYLFTFGAWFAALRHARQADLIHTTSYNAAVPAWIASKLTGTKAIITFHERWGALWDRLPWMSSLSKKLHRSFETMITKFGFEKFVAVSDATRDSLIIGGVDPERVVRIYNGIKYEGFPSHNEAEFNQPFQFLFFGRVGYAKGLDILILAYDILLKKNKDHKLLLILPSEEIALYRNVLLMIEGLGIGDHISIKHDLPYDDLLDEIAHADAVVIPSYSEGFCFAAVETMAIGTPIISSGQGALKEVVTGKHITLESHTSRGLSNAMSDAIKGNWTISEERRYELDDTVQAYLKLYEEIIDIPK